MKNTFKQLFADIANEEQEKKPSKPILPTDLDDYIFNDDNIKYQSER